MISNERRMMSHTVTVTRTTTTTSTSAIILNTGYLKTLPGFLKLLQVIAGAVALFLVVYYRDRYRYLTQPPELFFIAIACTFFIGSLCLLVACLISISTAPFIAKTSYEVVYHMVAFILYLIAAIILLIDVNNHDYKYNYHQPIYVAAILGLVVAALYLVSTILAFRAYRGT